MLDVPEPFGLTRAAFVFTWVAEKALTYATGSDAELTAHRVAMSVCTAVADWWPRFPACRTLLEGPYWDRYLEALTVRLMDGQPVQSRDMDLGNEFQADSVDHMAATLLAHQGEGLLLSMPEQQAVHLRYRGLPALHVGHVLGVTDEEGRALLQEAIAKLEDGIADWTSEHPDPDS